MMRPSSLKSYLVEIGYDVDKDSWKAFLDKDKKANKKMKDFAKSTAKRIGVIGSAFVALYTGVAKFIDKTAQADLKIERFARQMWTTEKNARSLQSSLSALGMEYQDLFYATPEEYKRFLELNQFGKSLEAPAGADETLQKIRGITGELAKLRLFMTYFPRWVAYYLGKFFGGNIDKLRDKVKKFMDTLRSNMPKIAATVAKVLYHIIDFGRTIFTVFSKVLGVVKGIFEFIGPRGVAAVSMIGLAIKALTSGPFGTLMAILSAVFLLIDDFLVYSRGGKSYFDWGWVSDFSGKIDSLKDSFSDIADELRPTIDAFKEWFDELDVGKAILDTIKFMLDGIAFALEKITSFVHNQLTFGNLIEEEGIESVRENTGRGKKSNLKLQALEGRGTQAYAGLKDTFIGGLLNWMSGGYSKFLADNANAGAAYSSTSSSVSSTTNMQNEITIYAGSNATPTDIGNAVVGGLQSIKNRNYSPSLG